MCLYLPPIFFVVLCPQQGGLMVNTRRCFRSHVGGKMRRELCIQTCTSMESSPLRKAALISVECTVFTPRSA